MLHTIIPIYENELLYSWIARYYKFSGFLKYRSYNLFLFGRDLVANVDMNDSIYFFKKNFNNITVDKMSTAENIIKYMTLFPYYTMFMDKEDKQECMKKLLTDGNKKSNREYLRYYGFYPRSTYQRFHICPKCAEEQIIEHGERYLILEQQIPENRACFKHRIMFNYYDIKKDNQHYDINDLI